MRAALALIFLIWLNGAQAGELLWPIDCTVGKDCSLGYPDTDRDGRAHNCRAPGYKGHEGTDISISQRMMDAGTNVYAAAAGEVLWVFDGKHDRCPDPSSPDCRPGRMEPGSREGNTVCTEMGPYCRDGGRVRAGQVIAKVGSAGNSSGPHLHFEVWGRTYYDPVDPWAGECGPNRGPSLWRYPEQPWFRK